MIVAVLPVKAPSRAKQRLSALLGAREREALARWLYEHTLEVLATVRGIDRILVATSDEETIRQARLAGADVLEEIEQLGHSVSANAAAGLAMGMGASTAILLPIDIPLVTGADIEEVIGAAQAGVVIVPSADGSGTNALALTPPEAMESRFGPNSFDAHLQQARSRGLQVRVVRPPGLVFDLDTPEDAGELLARAPESRAARLLREWMTTGARREIVCE